MDIEELKRQEPNFLQVARKKVNGRKTWVCPECGNGNGKSGDGIVLDPTNGVCYKCFKCGFYGDVIELFKRHNGITDNSEAFRLYREHLNLPTKVSRPRHPSYEESPSGAEIPDPASRWCRDRDTHHFTSNFKLANKDIIRTDYHRGISLETLNRFKVGFIEKWRHPKTPQAEPSPRLIIPTSESSYLARSTVDSSKIKVGHVHIFNIDALRTAQQPVFVVEGELDALSIIDVGGEAIALGGVSNVGLLISEYERCRDRDTPTESAKIASDKQLAQRKLGSNVTLAPAGGNYCWSSGTAPLVIALDNDKVGKDTADKLSEQLERKNISFYRYDDLYGDHKDANEVLMSSREKLKTIIETTVEDVINQQNAAIEAERKEYQKTSLGNYLDAFINGSNTECISTGFQDLDSALDGGLFEGLYIFGAVSSLGKTTLVLQISDQIAGQNHDVLIFSLEMAKTELMAKSLSRLTWINAHQNRMGSSRDAKTTREILTGSSGYSEKAKEIFRKSVEDYRAYIDNIYVHEGIGNIGTEQVRSEVDRHIRCTGKKPVVVIDYTQILAPANTGSTDKQNMDKTVLELKRISRDFSIPVIGISSFNRANYKETVNMTAFKESGSLEYGSDVLIGLQLQGMGENNFNFDAAKKADPRNIELVILKNRNGATGKHLKFNYFSRFNCFQPA